MRKIKQTLAFVLVLIVVFSMCSLALAYSSNTATWSSTICTNRFTTDQYICPMQLGLPLMFKQIP